MESYDAKARTGIGELALKAFFDIAEQWHLNRRQAMTILGLTATSTYANWKNGKGRNIPRDTLERISYVVAIDRSIPQTDADLIGKRSWLEQVKLSEKSDRTLFTQMMGGNVADLYLVRQTIDKRFQNDEDLLIDSAFHATTGGQPIHQLHHNLL